MAQGRFLDAVDKACDQCSGADPGVGAAVDVAALTQALFDRWLTERRYDDLVQFIHQQYEHGGGDRFIDALGDALCEDRDLARLSRLWKGVIAGRRQQFWIEQRYALKSGLPDNVRDAAHRKASALEAMARYRSCLLALGNAPEAARIQQDQQLLEAGRKRKLPAPDPRPMDEALFWQLIETARRDVAGAADLVRRLTDALAGFNAGAIKAFQRILDARLAQLWSWDLWALAYMARNGCSDDAFDGFRAWVVSQGRVAFEAALAGPEALADLVALEGDLQCEGLMYAAANAYLERQDREMALGMRPRAVCRGEPWRVSELPVRYAGLWKRFSA